MSASAKTLAVEKTSLTEDWTVVLPRRGKQRRKFVKCRAEEQQPWAPTDHEIDTSRESKLMHKMELCKKKLERSQFFSTFVEQIQTSSEMLNCVLKVLGSEQKMQMVIYGIGSIETYEPPRMQLGLAILLKERFNWIGEVQVFDPVLSATETKVLETLGCAVLALNEQGRRLALKPTLFFMPHCEAELYDNLLQTNWRVDRLKHIVLLGNSFRAYEQHVSVFKSSAAADLRKHILAATRFASEFGIKTVTDDYFRAFHDLSWHFFSLEEDAAVAAAQMELNLCNG